MKRAPPATGRPAVNPPDGSSRADLPPGWVPTLVLIGLLWTSVAGWLTVTEAQERADAVAEQVRRLDARLGSLSASAEPLTEIDRRLQREVAFIVERPPDARAARAITRRLTRDRFGFVNVILFDRHNQRLASVLASGSGFRSIPERLYLALSEPERLGDKTTGAVSPLAAGFLGERDLERFRAARGRLSPARIADQPAWWFWTTFYRQPPPERRRAGAPPPEPIYEGGLVAWFAAAHVPRDLGFRAEIARLTRDGTAAGHRFYRFTRRHARRTDLPGPVRHWLRRSAGGMFPARQGWLVCDRDVWVLTPAPGGTVLAGRAIGGAVPANAAAWWWVRLLAAALIPAAGWHWRGRRTGHAHPSWVAGRSATALVLLLFALAAGAAWRSTRREAVRDRETGVQALLETVQRQADGIEDRLARFCLRLTRSRYLLPAHWDRLRSEWRQLPADTPLERLLVFAPHGALQLDLGAARTRRGMSQAIPPAFQRAIGGVVRQVWQRLVAPAAARGGGLDLDAMVDGMTDALLGPGVRARLLDALTETDRLQSLRLGDLHSQIYTSVLRDRRGQPVSFMVLLLNDRPLTRRFIRQLIRWQIASPEAIHSTGIGGGGSGWSDRTGDVAGPGQLQLGLVSQDPDELPLPVTFSRYPFVTAIRRALVQGREPDPTATVRAIGSERWLVAHRQLAQLPGYRVLAIADLASDTAASQTAWWALVCGQLGLLVLLVRRPPGTAPRAPASDATG